MDITIDELCTSNPTKTLIHTILQRMQEDISIEDVNIKLHFENSRLLKQQISLEIEMRSKSTLKQVKETKKRIADIQSIVESNNLKIRRNLNVLIKRW